MQMQAKAEGFLSRLRALGRGFARNIGRAVDTALAIPFPQMAMERTAAREKYLDSEFAGGTAFDAARRDRTTNDWAMDRLSPDQAVIPEMGDVNARARAAVRNDWAGKSTISSFQRNDIGTGIIPMAAAVDKGGKPRSQFNKKADKLWRRWARDPKLVDSEKTKSFNAMMRLADSEWVTVGNAFIVKNYTKRRDHVGLSLTMYEAEQLASEQYCEPLAGNEMRGGVEVNAKTGEAVAYWLFTQTHPYESAGFQGSRLALDEKPTRIPAERVLHLHRQTRPGETISPSRLSATLYKMHGQKRYDDNEQFGKGIESFPGFVIERDAQYGGGQIGFNPPAGSTAGPGGVDSVDTAGNRQIDFQPGMVPELYRGEKLHMLNPQRPGAQYADYTDRQIGMVAAGAELSYPLVSRDYSKGNFSSQRQGRLDDEKLFDINQQDFVDMVIREVWEEFITLAIMEGRLEAAGFLRPDGSVDEDYLEATFQPPPKPWVDPAKEAAAAKIAIDYRLNNRGRILNGQGVSWRQNFEETAEQSADAAAKHILLPEEAEEGPTVSPSEPKPRGKAAKPRDAVKLSAGGGARGKQKQNQRRRRIRRSDAITDAIIRAAVGGNDD